MIAAFYWLPVKQYCVIGARALFLSKQPKALHKIDKKPAAKTHVGSGLLLF